MTGRLAVLLTIAVLAFAGPASAATLTVCPVIGPGCTFDNVQTAVNAAAAGDTITIEAGTYLQTAGVVITKALTLDGAGPNQTIIDGNNTLLGTLSEGQIRIDPGAGDVTIKDLAVQKPVRRSATATHFEIYVRNTLAASTVTIDNVDLRGSGTGGLDDGLYAEATAGETNLTNSTIGGQDFNPVLLERQTGPATVSGNTITKTSTTVGSAPLFIFSYQQPAGTFFNVTTPQRVVDNIIHAGGFSGISLVSGFQSTINPKLGSKFTDVTISGNTIDGVGNSLAINLDNQDPSASGAPGEIASPRVQDNTLTGTGVGAGVRLRGFVSNADISGNTIRAFAQGVTTLVALPTLVPGGSTPSGTELHFNRVVGNTAGLAATVGSVDAENNWWGCNAGPGAAGCDPVTGAGADFDPWLVLRAVAVPPTVKTGESTTITADLTRNSAGGTPSANTFPDGTALAFSTTAGGVAPASAPTAGAGAGASTVFTAPSVAGPVTVTSALDNQQVPLLFDVTGGDVPVTPDTFIKRRPMRKGRPRSIVRFGSTVPGSTFTCRVDKTEYKACTNPQNFRELEPGRHRFRVFATGPTGLVDPTPAKARFFVRARASESDEAGSGIGHRR